MIVLDEKYLRPPPGLRDMVIYSLALSPTLVSLRRIRSTKVRCKNFSLTMNIEAHRRF